MDTPCVFCEVGSWFSDCCPSQQPEKAVMSTTHKSCFHFAPVSDYPVLLVLSCWLQNPDSPLVVLPMTHLLLFVLLLFHSPAVWPTFSFSDRTQNFALLLRWYVLNYIIYIYIYFTGRFGSSGMWHCFVMWVVVADISKNRSAFGATSQKV